VHNQNCWFKHWLPFSNFVEREMSDSFLRYIPIDPNFRPAHDAALSAVELLRSFLPEAQAIDSDFFERVRFVDCGSNWSGVLCPSCGADVEPWFFEAMNEAAKTGFTSLLIRSPCCETAFSLNDLDYLWPVGFAQYVLEAFNPDSRGLTPSQLSALETTLGCAVREIPAHI
jgi:hypothetical protein